jgi:prolyl-tRNA synthetase
LIPVGLSARASDADRKKLLDAIEAISKTLTDKGVRVMCDTRLQYSPGWKFSEYELRGFPLRVEFGPRDQEKGVVTTVRRDTGEKGTVEIANIADGVDKLLAQIQKEMLERSRKSYEEHIKYTHKWDEVVGLLNAKNVLRLPHCGSGDCAEAIKKETAEMCKTENMDPRAPSMGAKGKTASTVSCLLTSTALCVPFEQRELPAGTMCIRPSCGRVAVNYTQFGRSY